MAVALSGVSHLPVLAARPEERRGEATDVLPVLVQQQKGQTLWEL
jgi:hypothetical protein